MDFKEYEDNPRKLMELLKSMKETIGEETFKGLFQSRLNNLTKEEHLKREANIIKLPKTLFEDNIEELKMLESTINEVNLSYYNKMYISLALLSRKAIIDFSHAMMHLEKVDKEERNEVVGKSFEKYIDWINSKRYLTPKNEKLLRSMKNESNYVNHGRAEIKDVIEKSELYYEAIKQLIESNIDWKEI